jgi:hypothetical protein
MEITKLHEACLANMALRHATGGGQYIIGLHSTLSSGEQQAIFERAPTGTHPACGTWPAGLWPVQQQAVSHCGLGY